jgi:hypothetical protein
MKWLIWRWRFDQFFLFLICLDRKYISLQILEEDSYEKDVLFYLEIDEPRQLGGKSFFYTFIYSIHISLILRKNNRMFFIICQVLPQQTWISYNYSVHLALLLLLFLRFAILPWATREPIIAGRFWGFIPRISILSFSVLSLLFGFVRFRGLLSYLFLRVHRCTHRHGGGGQGPAV